jgi:hypothetical protein
MFTYQPGREGARIHRCQVPHRPLFGGYTVVGINLDKVRIVLPRFSHHLGHCLGDPRGFIAPSQRTPWTIP